MAQENKEDDSSKGFERNEAMIEEYVKMSIDPEQNPIYPKLNEIVNAFGNIEGKICVDIGTGPGIMLPFLNEAVGKDGHIYAVDIDKNFLQYCSNKVIPTFKYKQNVKIIQSKVDDLCLPKELKGKIDLFLLAFVVNYLQEKDRYKQILSQVMQYLIDGGMVVVIDFDQEFSDKTFGAWEEETDEHNHDKTNDDAKDDEVGYGMNWKYLEPEQIEKLFNEFGLKLDGYILKNVVSGHHCLVFKKNPKT